MAMHSKQMVVFKVTWVITRCHGTDYGETNELGNFSCFFQHCQMLRKSLRSLLFLRLASKLQVLWYPIATPSLEPGTLSLKVGVFQPTFAMLGSSTLQVTTCLRLETRNGFGTCSASSVATGTEFGGGERGLIVTCMQVVELGAITPWMFGGIF